MAQHLCAVPGCTVRVASGILMCKPHWYSVPLPQRTAVNATWRAVTIARRKREGGSLGQVINAYRDAVADAVAAVQRSLP